MSVVSLAAGSSASSSSKSKSKKKLPQPQTSPSVSATHVNPAPGPETSATGADAVLSIAAVAGTVNENGERQRGPVEEVIAKRMRQLGKKLVILQS